MTPERDQGVTPIQVEIERVTAAARRAEAELADYRRRARGACCPSCKFGDEYVALCEAQGRRLGWLTVLLHKAGLDPVDAAARAVESTAGGG